MESAITFATVVAGLILSLAIGLLAEEFIFGQVLRLFVAQRTHGELAVRKSAQKG
jgi:hypothetical protein